MNDASCDASAAGMARGTERDAPVGSGCAGVIDRLEGELAELRAQLEIDSHRVVRAERLELVDTNGAVRVRVGWLGDEDVVGVETRRMDGSLSAFFGQVAGEGSLMFTGGHYGAFVVDFGATELGGHLRLIDPNDPQGARVQDILGEARLGPYEAG